MGINSGGIVPSAITDVPPADAIQIDFTQIQGGTPGYVLIVNPDGTLGQIPESSVGITVDTTAISNGTANAIAFQNTDGTFGEDATFLYSEAAQVLVQYKYTATALDSQVHTFIRGRGSISTPAAVSAGDLLGQIAFGGYSSNVTLFSGGLIQSRVTSATPFSASTVAMGIGFYTGGSDSATFPQRMFIASNGDIGVNYPSTTAFGAQLDIIGKTALSSNILQRWRNSANTGNMFSITGDNVFNILDAGAISSTSPARAILETYLSSSSLKVSTVSSGSGSTYSTVTQSGATPGYSINTLTAGGDSAAFDISHAGYVWSASDSSANSLIYVATTATLTVAFNVLDTSSNGVSENYLGGSTDPFWSMRAVDNSHDATLRVNPSNISINNPLRATTGVVPAAAADSFAIYSADIIAGNAALHTIAEGGQIYYMGSLFGLASNHSLIIATNNTDRGRFDTSGNFILGGSAAATSATKSIAFYSGTAPSANITDGYSQYSADISAGNAAPHFRTENGSIIKLFTSAAYTVTNVSIDRSYDADATSLNELADIVGTLINDLKATNIIG